MDIDELKKDIGVNALSQIGYITKDLNLYDLFEGLGKSPVGRSMDMAGRHMFNHRFAGGHLWWKELANRPLNEWSDVMSHLASDFWTKAGLPYAVDGTTIKNPDLLKTLGGSKNIASQNNWAMMNGFEFSAGVFSLAFSIYDAATLSEGYSSDFSLALDGVFVGLNILGGIATANPLLIVAAIVKTSTMLRKSQMILNIETSSPFDLNVNSLLELDYSFDIDVDRLFKNAKYLDFMNDKHEVSYNFM